MSLLDTFAGFGRHRKGFGSFFSQYRRGIVEKFSNKLSHPGSLLIFKDVTSSGSSSLPIVQLKNLLMST